MRPSTRAALIAGAITIPLITAVAPAAAQTPSTTDAITPSDLRLRLETFASDSMLGREAGTEGAFKATAYIAAELERLGLTPMGENGTFFQNIPLGVQGGDASSRVEGDIRCGSWRLPWILGR